MVAPLRGRGLKQKIRRMAARDPGRSLTGAWIETAPGVLMLDFESRSLTGAWIETGEPAGFGDDPLSLPYGGVD